MPVSSLRQLSRIRLRPDVGWIGIDVGSGSLKIAQVERVATGWQICRGRIFRNRDISPLQSTAQSNDWLVDTLRSELSGNSKFVGRQAACVLSPSVTELRSVDLPAANDDELREMVEVELGSSAADSDREFDFWPFDQAAQEAKDSMTHLNVLSVESKLASRIAADLLETGLECRILDGCPFTSARAVNLVRATGDRDPVAALDWGDSGALFTIIAGTAPSFTRVLRNCGLVRLKEAIRKGLNFGSEDTDQLLTRYGLPGAPESDSRSAELQEVTADLTGDLLDTLVDELRKTISFLKTRGSEPVPKRIWLLGGGASIKNVAAYLSQRLDFPFAVWTLPQRAVDYKNPPSILANAAALSALAWTR